jgi:hypothetical protein
MILGVLSIIGDGRAQPTVGRLARRPGDPDVRDAATRLLSVLKERAEKSEASGLLLRPSHAAANAGQVLLRAASGIADSGTPETLVRASQSPGDDGCR